MATELNALDFKLDQFAAPFVADGPKDERELEALYLLARLYRANGYGDNAREVFVRIAAARPGYRDVAGSPREARERASRLAHLGRAAARRHAVSARHRHARGLAERRLLSGPPGSPAAAGGAGGSSQEQLRAGSPPPAHVERRFRAHSSPAASAPLGTSSGDATDATAAPSRPAHRPPRLRRPLGLLAKGSMVAEGRYRVEAKDRAGGMAAVYRATDLELGEEIAMKLFLQPSDDPQLLIRFKQELTLSRGLAHPNIVRLYDIGQHQRAPLPHDGAPSRHGSGRRSSAVARSMSRAGSAT